MGGEIGVALSFLSHFQGHAKNVLGPIFHVCINLWHNKKIRGTALRGCRIPDNIFIVAYWGGTRHARGIADVVLCVARLQS